MCNSNQLMALCKMFLCVSVYQETNNIKRFTVSRTLNKTVILKNLSYCASCLHNSFNRTLKNMNNDESSPLLSNNKDMNNGELSHIVENNSFIDDSLSHIIEHISDESGSPPLPNSHCHHCHHCQTSSFQIPRLRKTSENTKNILCAIVFVVIAASIPYFMTYLSLKEYSDNKGIKLYVIWYLFLIIFIGVVFVLVLRSNRSNTAMDIPPITPITEHMSMQCPEIHYVKIGSGGKWHKCVPTRDSDSD